MPVILSKDNERLWLEGNIPKEDLLGLLQTYNAADMKAIPIKAIDGFVLNSK
ncbi:SOS response-associated peptidase [Adhaeribacter arboris]|uniref:SOS response-associated peptidase n=1 Tax=Adhaeribacter arboris TaxID=2072846 RepID=UPI0011B1DBDC|nr:SOS response-associated peptidase [Adhaeribacter arboris]